MTSQSENIATAKNEQLSLIPLSSLESPVSVPVKTFKLSPEKIAVIDFVRNPKSGNVMVSAVAGSGKTTVLIEVLKILTGKVAFCAFAKDISIEVNAKVESIKDQITCDYKIGTTHSFGNSAVRRCFPRTQLMLHGEKITQLMEVVVNEKTGEIGVPLEFRAFVRKAYQLARQSGVGVNPNFRFSNQQAWFDLVDHFDLESELFQDSSYDDAIDIDALVRQACTWTAYVIKLGTNWASKMIDFEDMIYLPLILNLKMWTYQTVLVDECQDINWTKRSLVGKILAPGGRAIFVGDKFQAIMAFSGADSESIANISQEFNTTTLPLSFSYRCPKSGVRLVQQWNPQIQAAPDAIEGKVETIDEKKFWTMNLTSQDAVLCRNNAPLVDLFFSLLQKGIPAHIEGKDFSEDLIKVVNRFPKIKSLPTLIEKLEDYKEKQIQKWLARGNEAKADRIADVVESIIACAKNLPAESPVTVLKTKIVGMFKDSEGNKVPTLTLTTIHKSKGREWDVVFWYGRNLYNPSKYARKDWQVEAEKHLQYVAGTRFKKELYDVVLVAKRKKVV